MFDQKLMGWMKNFNRLIHALLAVALAVACLMVIWDFGAKAFAAFETGNASRGFFQALGSLFILWTLSTLISAEINYMQTGRVYVRVFVEVCIISLIREIIVQPVELISNPDSSEIFNTMHYGLLLAALLVAGVVYKLVSNPELDREINALNDLDA